MNEKKEVLPRIRRQPVCSLGREMIWEGVAPPHKGTTQCAKVARAKDNCKAKI